jgi:hypothetical protein
MNNKKRFFIRIILPALLLLAAGLVWFSSRKNDSGSVPVVKTDVAARQTNRAPQPHSPPPAFAGNDIPKSQPEYTFANSSGSNVRNILARSFKLNDEEVRQIAAILDSSRQRVFEVLADHATVTEATKDTVRIETRMPEEQAAEIEEETFSGMYKIIGAEKWKFMDADLDTLIRSETDFFGRGRWAYTVTGMEDGLLNPDMSKIRPFAETAVLHVLEIFDGPDGGEGSSGYFFSTHEGFKERMGKLAVKALQSIETPQDGAP